MSVSDFQFCEMILSHYKPFFFIIKVEFTDGEIHHKFASF